VNNRRLTARDYKSARRGGLNLGRWRDLGYGFGAGLLVALVIYVGDHRGAQGAAESGGAPTPRHAAARSAGTGTAADAAAVDAARTSAGNESPDGTAGADGAAAAAGPAERYDFYDGLPKFEVVVPEKEHGTRVDAAARVSRPGTYFLQAGSYRNVEDANRIQAQLARQQISANVQRVALDADVWYRIRIGPINDLGQLNRVRQQLQAAKIVSLVIRVDD
jgi:cell division septation protein DedD